MSKPLLLSVLISTGIAAAALAALRLASEPQANAASGGDTVRVVTPALAVAPSVERAASPPSSLVVELAELRIRAAAPVHRSRKPRPEPAPAPDLVPCSDWREIGPVYSTRAGEAPRQRRVQLLCAAGSDR